MSILFVTNLEHDKNEQSFFLIDVSLDIIQNSETGTFHKQTDNWIE